MLRILTAASAMALLSACATTELEPIDPAAFVAATSVEDRTDYPVEIVETAVALPLPGQMMPIGARVTTNPDGSVTRTWTRTVSAPSVSPAEAIRQGRTSALIEPSVDGYVNATIVPGRSELMPVTRLAGISVPAITWNGEAGSSTPCGL